MPERPNPHNVSRRQWVADVWLAARAAAAGGLAGALLFWVGVTAAHGQRLRGRDSPFLLFAACAAGVAALPPASTYRAVRQIRRPKLWIAIWTILGAFIGPAVGIVIMIVLNRD